MTLKPIHIVGGGLAGLSLGIALRRREIPATIWEAGHYPRHRVCGEFISGRGLRVLRELGLYEGLTSAGAIHARNARFFFGDAASPVRPVAPPAVCFSRYKMDALLARNFQACGGELRQNAARRERCFGEGTVRATGRRVQPVTGGWRWFGLKVHAGNVPLTADLEMHCVPGQYVGVARIEDDKVNICGLFRRPAGESVSARSVRDLLRGSPGSLLERRLEHAVCDESSFCTVAGLHLAPQRATRREECCIGDALTMIPPATGNGMSMAFEAAAIAAGPLEAYSRDAVSWQQACGMIARSCDQVFSRRLRWAGALQQLLFMPCMSGTMGRLVLNSAWVWNTLFARTR